MNDDVKNLEQTFVEKFKRKIPDENDRLRICVQTLAISGTLIECLSMRDIHNLPDETKYALALQCANLRSMISDDDFVVTKDISDEGYVMGEQTQERITRMLKQVVTELHNSFKEDELEVTN